MPKKPKYKEKELINPIFNALRGIESYKFLIWLTKTFNPTMTFEEIAEKYDIDPRTAFNYYHQAEDKLKIPIVQRVEEGLKLLDDLWLESIKFNLDIGQPIVTVEYGKGRGFLRQKFEIEDKRSPEEFKKNLVANTSRLLGSRVDMTEPITKRYETIQSYLGGPFEIKVTDFIHPSDGKDYPGRIIHEPEVVIDLPKAQESVPEPQGEEIKGKDEPKQEG